MNHSLFGTDGIRTVVGHEPLTLSSLTRLGYALGQWAHNRYACAPRILLGHDTRVSCSFIKSALSSGLVFHAQTVYDTGTIPSPALMRIMQLDKTFDLGIIISASHNPYYDNGIKLIDARTGKLQSADEEEISLLFKESPATYDYSQLGTIQMYDNAAARYVESLVPFFPAHFLRNKTIVLDCAQGAAYHVAPALFAAFGAKTIVINDNPDGYNINKDCGAVHPETVQKAVLEHQADAGFAFDGDADRVVAVNKDGDIKNGDDILALLLKHPAYQHYNTIVGTIMSNQGLEAYIQAQGKTFVRTSVGDKYISDYLTQHSLGLGGEPSGHIITRDYLETGDGIFSALRILETLIETDNWHMNTFKKFPQVLINVPIKIKRNLNESPVCDIIAASKEQLHAGRIIVRYSGTEPLLRIMIEDENYDHAHAIGTQLSQKLQQEL